MPCQNFIPKIFLIFISINCKYPNKSLPTPGMQLPTSGTIRVDNADVVKNPRLRRKIGYSQSEAMYIENLTVYEQLLYFCKVTELYHFFSNGNY